MQRLPLTRNATRQTAKMQAHFPHQILPFRSEPEPAKYWLRFQTPPRIQVPRRPSVAVLPGFPAQNQAMHRWKKRCHLSALKPDRQSQYRKEQLQNPVKHIQFSPGKCLRDQIGSKSAVPSVPRQKKEHRQWDRHKADSLVWISSTFPINCFTFCKSTANSRPVRPNKIPKKSDTSPSLCPSMTGSAKEEPKIFQPQRMRSCRCRKRRNCRRKQCGICHTSTHHYFHRKKTAANGV